MKNECRRKGGFFCFWLLWGGGRWEVGRREGELELEDGRWKWYGELELELESWSWRVGELESWREGGREGKGGTRRKGKEKRADNNNES